MNLRKYRYFASDNKGWQPFRKNVNYDAFLISRNNSYFFTDDSLTINSDLIIIVSVDLAEACPAI